MGISGKHFMMLCVAFLAMNFNTVRGALSAADKIKILTFWITHIAECSEDHAVADDAMKTILDTGSFSAINPCFLACIMKKVELLDKDGMLDEKSTLKLAKEFLSSEDQKIVPHILKSCNDVNEKPVTDGEKGCERIKLVIECATPFISLLFPTK